MDAAPPAKKKDLNPLNPAAPFDPRAVANLLLDLADAKGMLVTNLSLQKLLYFAHGHHLISRGQPLVGGYFEAWTHGPVHPTVYASFKIHKGDPITTRASSFDFRRRTLEEVPVPTDEAARNTLDRVLNQLGRVPAGRLREISHAPRGPWAETKNRAGTTNVLGVQISDKVTLERFRYLMVPLQSETPPGDPIEDTPLA